MTGSTISTSLRFIGSRIIAHSGPSGRSSASRIAWRDLDAEQVLVVDQDELLGPAEGLEVALERAELAVLADEGLDRQAWHGSSRAARSG